MLLATWFLERLGYAVSGYTQSHQALTLLQLDPSAFDLVVTDLNMPGQSGLDVAREALQLRTDLPVALISGYVTEEVRNQAAAVGVREVISKPNFVEELAQAIHRLFVDLQQNSAASMAEAE